MKKIFFVILMVPAIVMSNPVVSQLESVKVFMQGAQISRKAQAQIPSGIHEIVISNLPVQIDPNSIQMRATGDFTILSVSHRINHLESPQVSGELRMLQDSLEYYKNQIEIKQGQLKVYEEEESMLLANKSVGGSETGVKVIDLRAMADFFRSRLGEIKQLQITTRRDIQQLQERHNRVKNQIGQIASRQNAPVGQIVVTTSAQRAVRGNFEFSFVSPQAGWHAVYDIRSEDINKPASLVMKANVYQDTGDDWNNIQLVLSTGSPLSGGQKPDLNTWFLRFVQPVPPPAPKRMMESRSREPMVEIMFDAEFLEEAQMVMVHHAETQTTREYHIQTPYNVPTGNRHQLVEVQKFDVPSVYEYYSVPKISNDVFLIGKLTGWEENLTLPGEANLFFEGTYVGKTYIDPSVTKDTIEISLGQDRGIVVERKRMIDFSRKGILGRRVTETVAWEISARNNKRQPITLNIQDQVPVSTDADIQVVVEERSGAIFNEATGVMNWKVSLAPSETTKKNLRYTVRYPSDKQVRLE
jgi:uncharacterized protein (TIGR02231 family)